MLVKSRFWRSLIILWLMNVNCSECQISQHWEYISFLGPNFPGMRGLILVLMSNVYYFAAILVFLVVTARYLAVTARYCSLPVVTARYLLLLLIPTYSINGLVEKFLLLKPGLLKEKFSIAPWFLLPILGEVTGSLPSSRQSFLEILSSRKVERQIFRYLTKIPNSATEKSKYPLQVSFLLGSVQEDIVQIQN